MGVQTGPIAIGYSNGAKIVSSILLTLPNFLAECVLFRALAHRSFDQP